jgi:hypothetical protein
LRYKKVGFHGINFHIFETFKGVIHSYLFGKNVKVESWNSSIPYDTLISIVDEKH